MCRHVPARSSLDSMMPTQMTDCSSNPFLNHAAGTIADNVKRRELSELILRAGQWATLSSAYLKVGIDLLYPDAHWTGSYELRLELVIALAEAECYCGNFTARPMRSSGEKSPQ